MPHLELTVDQVIELVKQLPVEGKQAVLSALHQEFQAEYPELDPETREWLEADLAENLPPYDWGEQGVPEGKPVRYVPGVGIAIEGDKNIAQ